MADDDFNQHLDRIEAALPTLATKADLTDLRAARGANFATKADLAQLRGKVHDELVGHLSIQMTFEVYPATWFSNLEDDAAKFAASDACVPAPGVAP